MAIRTSNEARAVAKRQTRNTPGTCQLNVRTWFNAPSAGDRDGDGDADAVDGWLSEPARFRRVGDRNPPPGKPLAFRGGSKGYGHRALSEINAVVSTDMLNNKYARGYTSTVKAKNTSEAIAIIEHAMGVQYLGWSETIDGLPIPPEKKPATPATPKPTLTEPKKAPASWGRFVHLEPVGYMDYWGGILEADERNIGIDIDARYSKDLTGWALHWPTVGQNGLHDPSGKIKANRRIDGLTDKEILTLRGPDGKQKAHRVSSLIRRAYKYKVRVELEVKVAFKQETVDKLWAIKEVKALHNAGLLQIKTLAAMKGPNTRLKPWAPKFTTLLSFTSYNTTTGIRKSVAWPLVDYTRGKPVWV